MQKKVRFYADGVELAGLLHLPDDIAVNQEKRPTIIFCHGYCGSKEGMVAKHAAPFVEAGYLCLTYDNRGFGKSHGRKGYLIMDERVEDTRSAITFMQQQPMVDQNRIALFGLSIGAAVVLRTAVETPVACVISLGPFGDGERWLRSLRPYWEWRKFKQDIEEDRIRRVLTGQSKPIDALEIIAPPPELSGYYAQRREGTDPQEWIRSLESAESIIRFKPEATIADLSPKALLIIQACDDDLVSTAEVETLFKQAKEPKQLALISGATHTSLYQAHFQQSIDTARNFLGKYL